MNERGSYGNNGLSWFNTAWPSRAQGRVLVGDEGSRDRFGDFVANLISTAVFVGVGAYWGKKAAPKDPIKGVTIGGATGLLLLNMTNQTFALESIEKRLRLAR